MRLLIARRGRAEILEVPDPIPAGDEVLVETAWSAVSAGTERQAVQDLAFSPRALFRRARLGWGKALASWRRRGGRATLGKIGEAARKPVPLGYSATGRVLAVGSEVGDLAPGDWIVAVGPGAHHATRLLARRAFCAKLPNAHLARDASAGALVGVALHAMGRAGIEEGSDAAVFGLGAIGQFMVQSLRALTCRVAAFDPLAARRKLAAAAGAEVHATPRSEGGHFDAVFLCARARDPDLIADAIALCRRRARIVAVGEFPLAWPRESAYAREVDLRVSAGYGADRYAADGLAASRAAGGRLRTVEENLQTFLRWLDEGKISTKNLDPEVIPFGSEPRASSSAVLTFYEYSGGEAARPFVVLPETAGAPGALGAALVGPGRFAREVHLPNLNALRARYRLRWIVGHSPLAAREAAERFGCPRATCDLDRVLKDPEVDALVVATPHAGHAEIVEKALGARKNVFVEKPLALSLAEVARIEGAARAAAGRVLFVGFNRRFAPASLRIASDLAGRSGPLNLRYVFRQEPLPLGEWAGLSKHGGRFVGEACHAVDWICWLVGAPVVERSRAWDEEGAAVLQLRFADGSRALLAAGPRREAEAWKERVEVACGDASWILSDFTDLEVRRRDVVRAKKRFFGKGHREALEAFAAAIAAPPPGEDPFGFFASSRLVLELDAMLHDAKAQTG